MASKLFDQKELTKQADTIFRLLDDDEVGRISRETFALGVMEHPAVMSLLKRCFDAVAGVTDIQVDWAQKATERRGSFAFAERR